MSATDAWYVDKVVVVECQRDNRSFEFFCGKWLGANHGGGVMSLVLQRSAELLMYEHFIEHSSEQSIEHFIEDSIEFY